MLRFIFTFTPLLLFVPVASASDGVILTNKHRALMGGVTPSDAPGFPITISVRGQAQAWKSNSIALPPLFFPELRQLRFALLG